MDLILMSDATAIDRVDPEAVLHVENGRFFKTVPNCKTCNSSHRVLIETWKMRGDSIRSIHKRLETQEGRGIDISERSMDRHFQQGHAGPSIMDPYWREAEKQGVTLDEYEESLQMSMLVTQLTVKKFRQKLADDAFNPDFKEGLAAAKLDFEMRKTAGEREYDPNDMFVAISVLMSHVHTVLARYAPAQADSAMEYFSRMLQSDPILKELVEKSRSLETPDDFNDWDDAEAVDAEIVESEPVVDSQPQTEYANTPAEGSWDDADVWDEADEDPDL